MFDLLYIRQFTDQFVIAASEPVHERIFFAARLDPDNDLIAILPFMDILRDPPDPGNLRPWRSRSHRLPEGFHNMGS